MIIKSNKEDMLTEISSFISHLPIAVFVLNERGEHIISNQHWIDVIGLSSEEFNSLKTKDIFGNGFSKKVHQMVSELFSGKNPVPITVSIVHKITLKKSFLKISGSLFQEKYAAFSAVDVSETLQLQQTLLDKKNQFFDIIKSLGDIVLKLDHKGNYKNHWPADALHLFPEINFVKGKSLHDDFPEEVVHQFFKAIEKAIVKDQMTDLEFTCSKNQEEKWLLAKIAPIHVKGGAKAEEVLVIIRNITEEKKNLEQIDYKNRLINQLTSISNGPILHVIEDENVKLNFISGDITSLTGYTIQELKNVNWLEIIYKNDRDYVRKNIQELMDHQMENQLNLVYRIVTKGGNINWITDYISKSTNEGKEILFGVMLNVTEIQLLNNKLKQRDRILTKSGKVAKIGGWEYDLKTDQVILTDEIYEIYEVEKSHFNLEKSIDFFWEGHRPIIRKHFDDLLNSGKGFDSELQLVTGKGHIKWVKTIGEAEWYHGKVAQVYGVLQDITEKKEREIILQESEKRFNAAFELAPIGIGLVSPEGQWLKANLALCNFFEYPEEELKKIPLMKLKFMEDLDKALQLAKKTVKKEKQGGIYQLEKKYITKSNKVKWGNMGINIVKNDEKSPVYAIIQIVDITKNKKFEKDLILAKKEADEANKAKSNFLSSMSHEIRTPLNGVIGVTNLLLEEINESKNREKLQALKFSSDSLLLIVNDILDYSKIKSGALTLEENPFVLKRLVEAVKESNLQKSKELGNKIMVHYGDDLPEKVIGDELRIGQILNNLVNNAVKFTRNGTIDIFIKKTGQSNEWNTLMFSIKDEGIGIAKNKQTVIFDQFTQAESGTTRQYGGTGLGLSIVKGLLKEMNSEVILSSELGSGTEISFQLVLKSAKADQESDKKEFSVKDKDLQNKTILLVEDNPVNTMVVTDYIKKWKGKIIKAENGSEAIEMFLKDMDKINLILMDLQMPIMNGFEATKQIKKIKPDVPVIAMTASIGDKSKLEAFDYGMAAYVIKPFLPEEFYSIIKKHI